MQAAAVRHASPTSATIEPRRLRPPDLSGAPLHWLGGDPFLSSLLNALSLVFPPGERHFVMSVRTLAEQLTEPRLQQAVRGFVTQESWHSREHATFNEWLARHGIDAAAVAMEVEQAMQWVRENRTPERSLAITCALEHFTALMAESWLTDDALREQAHPSVRELWTWHAIEEIEHRAVAFDVYRATGGSERRRRISMLMTTFFFTVRTAALQAELMRHTGDARNVRSIAKGLWRMWGPKGVYTRMVPHYLRYFRSDFHPLERPLDHLVRKFEAELRQSGAIES